MKKRDPWAGLRRCVGHIEQPGFEPTKITSRRHSRALAGPTLLASAGGVPVSAYEIRMGRISGGGRAALELEGSAEGAVSDDGWTVGVSVHGLISGRLFLRAVLEALAVRKGVTCLRPRRSLRTPSTAWRTALRAASTYPHWIGSWACDHRKKFAIFGTRVRSWLARAASHAAWRLPLDLSSRRRPEVA